MQRFYTYKNNIVFSSQMTYFGGKLKQAEFIVKHLPYDIENLEGVDVFGGGISVSISLSQICIKVYSNDLNVDLINYYKFIQNNPKKLLTSVKRKIANLNTDTVKYLYKDLNEKFTLKNATNMVICSLLGFDSKLYTTAGVKTLERVFKKDFEKVIYKNKQYIDKIEFINKDFKNILENIKPNQFVFLDPPYYGVSQSYYGQNGKYHKGFDHLGLNQDVKKISKITKFMMTYDDCPEIRELYKEFTIIEAPNNHRKGTNKCKEIIIINY